MYRLGQKTEKYFETKVEYYAPYLLKDGMVQRMTQYETNAPDAEEIRTFVKYRNRADRLIGKVVEKLEGKLTEKFEMGRPDRLEQLSYLRETGDEQETVKVYTFYHRSAISITDLQFLSQITGAHFLSQIAQGRARHQRIKRVGDHRHVHRA